MLDWMNPFAFLQTIVRVLIVWIAFYGAGFLVEKFTKIKKLLPLLPREVSGILLLILLEIPLSIFGIMNRVVVPVLLFSFFIVGLPLLVQKAFRADKPSKVTIGQVILFAALLAVLVLNLTYASMPSLTFDDPLITYAVQPDRWLNNGKIYWIEETTFSGFPLTYEMMSVWPASLSSDRMDQLSVLQVFQMTMLLVALFRGMQILRIRNKLRIPLAIIVLLCTMLYYWSSLAKTDTAAMLFSTLALASAVREIQNRSINQYTSWLLMGLAIATKQTAILVFIPFALYKGHQFFCSPLRVKFYSLVFLAMVPVAFAARTMIHTGSPTYPVNQVLSTVKNEWKLIPIPEEIRMLNDRDSEMHSNINYSVAKHVGIFLLCMEGIFLILLGGMGVALFSRYMKRNLLLFIPLLFYFCIAIVVLWPPWWGAKYSILIYPFAALLGVAVMQEKEMFSSIFLYAVCIVSFVVPGFIIAPSLALSEAYRFTVARSVLTGSWDNSSGYQHLTSTPEGMTYMWMNSAATDGGRILSIHEEKRYFYDGEIYVGWRHPATQELYLDNTLEEECAILDEIGIKYVTFYRNDPCIVEMENRLDILDHIGRDDILEPVISVSGNYLVCRYNSPSESSQTR
ncbi:MAG: hypothetical protein J7K88_12175 [Candidatus Fermentibacteraceae bacterium]|nr:hypothetical protein [Candidatus Fermentibacteraceae bacterium]